jgi:hypothetical protein
LSLHEQRPIRLDTHSSTFCRSRSCLEPEKKLLIEKQALASIHCRASMPLLASGLLNSETLVQGQTIVYCTPIQYLPCPVQNLTVVGNSIELLALPALQPSLRRRSGESLVIKAQALDLSKSRRFQRPAVRYTHHYSALQTVLYCTRGGLPSLAHGSWSRVDICTVLVSKAVTRSLATNKPNNHLSWSLPFSRGRRPNTNPNRIGTIGMVGDDLPRFTVVFA